MFSLSAAYPLRFYFGAQDLWLALRASWSLWGKSLRICAMQEFQETLHLHKCCICGGLWDIDASSGPWASHWIQSPRWSLYSPHLDTSIRLSSASESDDFHTWTFCQFCRRGTQYCSASVARNGSLDCKVWASLCSWGNTCSWASMIRDTRRRRALSIPHTLMAPRPPEDRLSKWNRGQSYRQPLHQPADACPAILVTI